MGRKYEVRESETVRGIYGRVGVKMERKWKEERKNRKEWGLGNGK